MRSALPVAYVVDDDAVDPGLQRRIAAEPVYRAKHGEKHILRQVQRVLVASEQVERQVVDHALMLVHQFLTGLGVAGGAVPGQGAVGACRL